MKILPLLTAVVGIAVAMTLGAAPPAVADDVSATFNADNVAFAYSDGYWDKAHHWHKWRNANQAKSFRTAHKDVYHAWKHTRDSDQGWHEDAH